MVFLLHRVTNPQRRPHKWPQNENKTGTPVALALCLFHYSHILFQKNQHSKKAQAPG